MNLVKEDFIKAFSLYEEKALQHRRFKHADILPLLQGKEVSKQFTVEEIGRSVEDRSIFRLKYGQGPIKVLLWSQMHGDEPTATMALFDLFNFFNGEVDGFDTFRKEIAEKLTLYFIPMLNPDGAERYQRRTAMDVDMNRDARAVATVEGALLKAQAMLLKPDFAFNLHNQNNYYNIPGTTTPVTISLLAPAYDYARSVNAVRADAMRVIVGINKILQEFIPNAVAKYDDEHTPRGFGDNFQKWGASTILIESGAYAGDPEKLKVRKYNFIALLQAFQEIASGSYSEHDIADYNAIPFNDEQLHDVLIRNLSIEKNGKKMLVDVGIRQNEKTVIDDYYVEGVIEDIGDLQDFYGYTDLDVEGLHFIPAKLYSDRIFSLAELTLPMIGDLLKQGFAAIMISDVTEGTKVHTFPIQTRWDANFQGAASPIIGDQADFFIGTEDEIRYALINGYLIDFMLPLDLNMKNKMN
ncbi:M14 family zinc carboxypeptidase [Sphingobacterium detergens]|uniref:Zinc carboxypeptidase n=1 Tax=Sphingobacterium detergens TaxID=1145106 RepID=A0A420B8B9_SPHD1|nr:M14 family zinc carboxypeptidase [Sphingobacterium detergens]RKE52957.1 zinc carboxypeptidase [Sphingobacterium detergens]